MTTRKTRSQRKKSIPIINYQIKLPDDVWLHIFSLVAVPTLALIYPINKMFNTLLNDFDKTIWEPLCQRLWLNKVPESWKSYTQMNVTHSQQYQLSLKDSKRTVISMKELCSYDWAFRFKRDAGDWWEGLDPYWNALDAHSLSNANDWFNEELFQTFIQSFKTGTSQYMLRNFKSNKIVSNPGKQDALQLYAEEIELDIRWRITKTRRVSGRTKRGQFVQLNRWPSNGIERTKEWGWIMQNQWNVYVWPPRLLPTMHNEIETDVDRWL